MDNYYIYRISVKYDGFYPQKIEKRSQKGKFIYNWRAYLDNLEEGDIVLAYFFGSYCKDGIYAVTVVDEILSSDNYEANVVAEIIYASQDNYNPIIAQIDYPDIFKNIMYRPRGAEIIIPSSNEETVVELLKRSKDLTNQLSKLDTTLPGISLPSTFDIHKIPIINLAMDFSPKLKNRDLISVFWIRPKQATWMKPIRWLSTISSLFYKFKSGDTTYIENFAKKLAEKIINYSKVKKVTFDFILGVPLSEQKRKHGEIDRVSLLCEEASKITGIPYLNALKLVGGISRANYKRRGISSENFIEDYSDSLSLRRKGIELFKDYSGNILLIDDVYTDGITTTTVKKFLKDNVSEKIKIHVATLGIMTKVNNISSKFKSRWKY